MLGIHNINVIQSQILDMKNVDKKVNGICFGCGHATLFPGPPPPQEKGEGLGMRLIFMVYLSISSDVKNELVGLS